MTELVLTFEPPADPISMNKGDTWNVRTASALWRDRAHWAWCEAHPGVGPSGRAFPYPASVHVSLPFPAHRRRDPINFAKTVKHIVDGITLAGAWPDDTPKYVEQNVPALRVDPGGLVIVRVTADG